jgi:hypothetical protein
MKTIINTMIGGAVALSTCLGFGGPARADEPVAALKTEAAGLLGEYATTLLSALKGAIGSVGPVEAIPVCHDLAPKVGAEISARSGWRVARTSLKLRNDASAPDSYEEAVLREFAARAAAGESAETLVKAEIVETDGEKVFHLVKAIPTADLCLTCHGTEVKPEVRARLLELYPNDQATGFRVGDLRGAFTLSKRL